MRPAPAPERPAIVAAIVSRFREDPRARRLAEAARRESAAEQARTRAARERKQS